MASNHLKNDGNKHKKVLTPESYSFGEIEVITIPDDDELFSETEAIEIDVFTHAN